MPTPSGQAVSEESVGRLWGPVASVARQWFTACCGCLFPDRYAEIESVGEEDGPDHAGRRLTPPAGDVRDHTASGPAPSEPLDDDNSASDESDIPNGSDTGSLSGEPSTPAPHYPPAARTTMPAQPIHILVFTEEMKISSAQFIESIYSNISTEDQQGWAEREVDFQYVIGQFRSIIPVLESGAEPGKLLRKGDPPTENYIYACMMGGSVAGMISLLGHKNVVEIDLIVSRLGVSGAGTTMLERAVNTSDTLGSKGALYVKSLKSAIPFYKKLGFLLVDPTIGSMILDPDTSLLWKKIENSWRFIRDPGASGPSGERQE